MQRFSHDMRASVYALIAAAGAGYLALVFSVTGAVSSRYGIASLLATRMGPPLMVAAWLVGAHGVMLIMVAADAMPNKERLAYRRMATGIVLSIAAAGTTVFLRSVSAHAGAYPALLMGLLIVSNSIGVWGQCAAFAHVNAGATLLRRRVTKTRPLTRGVKAALAVVVSAFAGAVLVSIFTNPVRTSSPGPQLPTYFLPDLGIFAFVVMPFLFACALGLLATFRLIEAHRALPVGPHRRTAFQFTLGMILQLFGWILFQTYLSIGSARLSGLGLGWVTLTIVPFLLLILAGYTCIALSARRLAAAELFFALEDFGRPTGRSSLTVNDAKNGV